MEELLPSSTTDQILLSWMINSWMINPVANSLHCCLRNNSFNTSPSESSSLILWSQFELILTRSRLCFHVLAIEGFTRVAKNSSISSAFSSEQNWNKNNKEAIHISRAWMWWFLWGDEYKSWCTGETIVRTKLLSRYPEAHVFEIYSQFSCTTVADIIINLLGMCIATTACHLCKHLYQTWTYISSVLYM